MVVRKYLCCLTCGKELLLRTAIGRGEYQEFAFPCGGCGIEIRYGMNLFPKETRWEFSKLVNAKWIRPKTEPKDVLVIDPETLIPLDIGNFFSPFLLTAHLPTNVLGYHANRELRLFLCLEAWPVLRKCKVHFDNRNWRLYKKEFRALDPKFDENDENLCIAHFLRTLHRFSNAFRPFSDAKSRMLRQRINYAEALKLELCDDLRAYLRSIGWSASLFHELSSLKDRWSSIYLIVQPVYLSFYWDETTNSLDDFTLAQKRFDDLKPFFIDVYETLCRVSLIAAAIEGIIWCKDLRIQGAKHLLSLEDYRQLDNGIKATMVRNLVIGPVFSGMAENRLRNGIGHHSAHYDVKTDTIEYRNEGKGRITTDHIGYVRFCEKLAKLWYDFELVSVYIHWLVAREYGLKGKVV